MRIIWMSLVAALGLAASFGMVSVYGQQQDLDFDPADPFASISSAE